MYEVSLSPMVIKLKSGHEIASQIAQGKYIQSRVLVLVYGTLAECALQVYEDSLKYL